MAVSDEVHLILVDRAATGERAARVLCFAVLCATPERALALVRERLAFGEAARIAEIGLSAAEGKALNLEAERPKLVTELLADPLGKV
jgi:hypothetical protein